MFRPSARFFYLPGWKSTGAEPVTNSDESKHVFEAFLENSGMDFWELVAEEKNLLHSLKTTATKILNLTRVKLVIETLNLPQAEIYWNGLLRISPI
jgi:hypothetical protein